MKRAFCAILLAIIVVFAASAAMAGGEDTILALADGASVVTGSGATVNGDIITISEPGSYKASGTLTNGQIIVDVGKEEVVDLKLAGVTISCSYSAPIVVLSADKLEIKLIDGTENTLSDTFRNDPYDSDLPSACLYSADDLTIKGTGRLTVFGNNNNGINTKNDLKIDGGIIAVTAVNNAIRGKDSVSIRGGRVTINGCDDGIKSTETEQEGKGFVLIQGAVVYITASGDAIEAVAGVTIRDAIVYTYAEDMAIDSEGPIDVAEGCLIEN